VLQTKNLIKARTAFEKLNESPEFMVLWVDENLPIEYEDPEDLEKGYNILSKADIFLRRVKRRQYYRFWAYASDLMSSGVALAKKRPHTIFKRYQFPSWLLKMSRSKNIRNMQNSVLSKVGEYCHVSKQFLRESDLFYTFKYLFKSDVEFAAAMIASLELTKDDIAYLIDEPPDAHVVKFLQDAAIEQQTSKTVKLAPGKGEAVLGDFEGKRPGRRRKWKKVDRDYEGEEEEEDEEVRSKRREKKGEEQKRLFEF
jgi:replication factor C large subunit